LGLISCFYRPIFGGWLADAKLGQFRTICIGVAICGVAHVIMIISAIPSILQAEHAIGPFALSLYMLAVGAALFKPNIAPTVLGKSTPETYSPGQKSRSFRHRKLLNNCGGFLRQTSLILESLDQNPHKKPHVITRSNGSKAIVDPEATSESVMLW
jgi:dipeptide/tripeptide permease